MGPSRKGLRQIGGAFKGKLGGQGGGGEEFCLYEHFSDVDLETFKLFNVLILHERLRPSLSTPYAPGLLYPPHTSYTVVCFSLCTPTLPFCITLHVPIPLFSPLPSLPCFSLLLLSHIPHSSYPTFEFLAPSIFQIYICLLCICFLLSLKPKGIAEVPTIFQGVFCEYQPYLQCMQLKKLCVSSASCCNREQSDYFAFVSSCSQESNKCILVLCQVGINSLRCICI